MNLDDMNDHLRNEMIVTCNVLRIHMIVTYHSQKKLSLVTVPKLGL